MEALSTSLNLYDADVLKQMAATLAPGDDVAKLLKTKLISRLLVEIPYRAGQPDFVRALSDTDRAILALVLDRGGQVVSTDLVAPLLLSGMLTEAHVQDPNAVIRNLEALLEPLLLRGLLVNLTPPIDYSTRRHLRPSYHVGVSPEVAQALPRQLLKLPQPDPQRFAISPPEQISDGDPETLLRQLFFVWAGLLRSPARRLKSGLVAKADLRRLARELGIDLETQAEILSYMFTLLQATALVRATETSYHAIDDEHAQRFWQKDPGTQVRELYMAFINLDGFAELDFRGLPISGYGYGQYVGNAYKALNHQLLATLQQFPELSWISYDILMVLLNHGRSGSFALPEATLQSLQQMLGWSSQGAGGSALRSKLIGELQNMDTTVTLDLLTRWQWLGIIELGYVSGRAIPQAVRFSTLGRAVLRQETLAFNREEGQLILQPDFQLLALGPVPLATLLGIERIAQRETAQPAAVGYRLTRDSIYRALQNGASIGVICAFLSRITQQPLPQNVERTLEEWGTQHERIVVRRDVLVLQTATAEQLDTLLADRRLGRWLQRLDERTAWADARHTAKVQEQLWQLEILPAVSKGSESDLPRSLLWDEGRLLPRTVPPSLYVAGTVQRFAVPEGDGWRITSNSVREASNMGLSAPEILAQIERLTGEAIPAEWQQRLKAWSSHYGNAYLLQVRLLRLESAAILAEVRNVDRQLSRWLRPLTNDSGIAIIDDRNWETVVARLTELGINIEEGRWW